MTVLLGYSLPRRSSSVARGIVERCVVLLSDASLAVVLFGWLSITSAERTRLNPRLFFLAPPPLSPSPSPSLSFSLWVSYFFMDLFEVHG